MLFARGLGSMVPALCFDDKEKSCSFGQNVE